MYCKIMITKEKHAGSRFTEKGEAVSAYLVKGEFTSEKTDHWNLGNTYKTAGTFSAGNVCQQRL